MIVELPPCTSTRSYARRLAPSGGQRTLPGQFIRGVRPLARILISEDDQGIRELYARLLTDHGFEVVAAPRGDAGRTIDLALRLRPHLLITDVNKPGGLDGLALRAALRADERSAHLPVLIVSAVELGPRAAALGPRDDHLLKPFGFEVLLERAAALLPLSPAEHDDLAARAIARRGFAPHHPATGLLSVHGLAAALPAYTAAPGWAAAAVGLADQPALLHAYGRPRLDLLLGRLGDMVRAAGAPLAGHLGLDGQIALVGPASALDTALARVTQAFARLAARLGRAAPALPQPALAVRRIGPGAGVGLDLIALRRALRA